MPFRYRLKYGLVAADNPYRPHEKVLLKGEQPQAPDGLGMHYYGTVIRVGDELRMWYGVIGDDCHTKGTRMCYAVSTDGIHWEKSNLGLVESNGRCNNNLVHFNSPHSAHMNAILVLHDPQDPNPERQELHLVAAGRGRRRQNLPHDDHCGEQQQRPHHPGARPP